jgi:hypothetical protein
MVNLISLPLHILKYIQSFLTIRPNYNAVHFPCGGYLDDGIDWRNLLYTTKQLSQVRKETFYLMLKLPLTNKYVKDEQFRKKIDSMVINRSYQLGIGVIDELTSIDGGLRYLQGAHFIDFSNYDLQNIKAVSEIQEVWLTGCACENLMEFTQLRSLKLFSSSVSQFPSLPTLLCLYLKDCLSLTSLCSLPRLRLLTVDRYIDGIQKLKNLEYLDISSDIPLTDEQLSVINKIKHVTINMTEISDLYRLQDNDTLLLILCTHKELDFKREDIKKNLFKNIRKLSFSMDPALSQLPFASFKCLQYLTICDCSALTVLRIEGKTLKRIDIRECEALQEVKVLTKLVLLKMYNCPALNRLEILSSIEILEVGLVDPAIAITINKDVRIGEFEIKPKELKENIITV